MEGINIVNSLFTTQTAIAAMIFIGASVPPGLAEEPLGKPVLLVEMMPMPQGPPGAARGMMDDKMAMPPPGAAGPASTMPGMPAPSSPAPPVGMAAPGAGMAPMPGGMMSMMDMMMKKMQEPPPAPLDHVEGRIAFIKAELGITEAQGPAWDQFAQTLRTSREHLAEARSALVTSAEGQTGVSRRLEAYEHHLTMRLDSLRAARESFQRLYAMLSPTQKQSADSLVAPLLVSF